MSFILNLSIFLCKFHCYYIFYFTKYFQHILIQCQQYQIQVYNLTSEGDLDFQVDLSRRGLSQRTNKEQKIQKV